MTLIRMIRVGSRAGLARLGQTSSLPSQASAPNFVSVRALGADSGPRFRTARAMVAPMFFRLRALAVGPFLGVCQGLIMEPSSPGATATLRRALQIRASLVGALTPFGGAEAQGNLPLGRI